MLKLALYAGMPNHLLRCNTHPGAGGGCGASTNAGGLGIGTNGGLIWTSILNATKIDAIGWTGNGATALACTNPLPATPPSLHIGTTARRRIYALRGYGDGLESERAGNAYDSDNNSLDFLGFNYD